MVSVLPLVMRSSTIRIRVSIPDCTCFSIRWRVLEFQGKEREILKGFFEKSRSKRVRPVCCSGSRGPSSRRGRSGTSSSRAKNSATDRAES
ncbi:MAG: hypothetical protein EBX52_04530 [Proteobacteria bacterium]|nr:hypothetical protein [Pseudomonadota bacterium]